MSFTRGIEGARYTPLPANGRVVTVLEQERRSVRASRLAMGTLACTRCDAPVAIGADTLSTADPLACPYCGHSGPLREFLSLAAPSRPARVVVRIVQRQTASR